jgi:hypothetical protein
VALAIGASACQSTEDISANDQTDEDPSCNCILVNRDNPVLREDVALTDFPYTESAKRVADSKWAYKAFDTTLNVAGATGLDWALLGHDWFLHRAPERGPVQDRKVAHVREGRRSGPEDRNRLRGSTTVGNQVPRSVSEQG